MSFGIQLINDSGAVQIDQDYYNLGFRQKFTVNSISAASFYTFAGFEASGAEMDMVYFVVDYLFDNSVLAIAPPTGIGVAPVPLINESNSASPPPGGYKRAIFCANGTTPRTITCYIFDRPSLSVSPNTGYGIQIMNASGQMVFHSAIPYLRPRFLQSLRGSTVGTAISLNSSRAHAFVFCNFTQGYYYPASGGVRKPKNAGLVLSSPSQADVVAVNHYAAFGALGAGGLIDNNPSVAMVVDVSFM